jgi:uncharacterized protein
LSTFVDASPDDEATVSHLLGRPPAGRFAVVVRRSDGRPVVIENEPHLRDGTPMPTLYWLVDREIVEAVSRIESDGGVHRFEDEVDAGLLEQAHRRYAERRTSSVVRRDLVAPTGGVGGSRKGVKCLHAHLANHLVTHDDPVGAIVAEQIDVPPLTLVDVR